MQGWWGAGGVPIESHHHLSSTGALTNLAAKPPLRPKLGVPSVTDDIEQVQQLQDITYTILLAWLQIRTRLMPA